MYIDEVVIAGLIIVTLTLTFFVGFIWAIQKDIKKHGTGLKESQPLKGQH